MPDEHSLKAQIELNFESAMQSAQEFAKEVNTIATAFSTISTKAAEVDSQVGARVKEIYDNLIKANDIKISPKQIKDQITNAIQLAINQANIVIDTSKEVRDLKVTLRGEKWNLIERKLRTAITESINTVNFEDMPIKKSIKFKAEAIRTIRDKFEQHIKNSIDADSFAFTNTKGEVTPIKLSFGHEHMQHITDMLRDRALEEFGKLEIKFPAEMDKIKLDDGKIMALYQGLRDKLNNLVKGIKFDESLFSNIENIKFEEGSFKGSMEKLVTHLSAVQKTLRSLSLKVDEPGLKEVLANMKDLKKGLTDSLNDFFNSVRGEIKKLPTAQANKISAQVQVIDGLLNSTIDGRLEAIQRELLAAIGGPQQKINGDLALAPSVQKINEALLEYVKQSVPNVIGVNKQIDLDGAAEMIRQHLMITAARMVNNMTSREGKQLTNKELSEMDKVLYKEAKNLLDAVVGQTGKMVASFTNKIKTSAAFESFSGAEEKKIHDDMQASMSKLIAEFTGVIGNVVQAFGFASGAVKSFQQSAATALDELVKGASTPTATGKSLDFDLAVTAALEKTHKQVMESVAAWEPAMKPFSIDLDKTLQPVIKSAVTNMITAVKADLTAKAKGTTVGTEAFHNIERSIGNFFNNRMKNMTETITTSLSSFSTGGMGGFKVAIKDLDAETRKILAERMNMTVAEMRKASGGYLTGGDVNDLTSANVEAILRKFHAVIGDHATKAIESYRTALTNVPFTPDTSAVPYLIKKFDIIQGDIAKKVRELLDAQFKALAEQIKAINAKPVSFGYAAPATGSVRSTAVAAAAGAVSGAAAAQSIRAPRAASPSSAGADRYYYPLNDYPVNGAKPYSNPGGDTRSFMGSVVNTMRYITAGSLIGIPSMLLHSGFQSAKDFDYQMTKAKVNLTVQNGKNAIPNYSDDKTRRQVQNIALAYALDPSQAAQAFEVATRKYNDPEQAMVVADATSQLTSIEKIDPATTAENLIAMAAQFKMGSGSEVRDMANMLGVAANTKLTTVDDLGNMLKRSGSIFENGLGGYDERTKRAVAVGLGTLYTSSTAKAGGQAGTFFKNIMTTPWSSSNLQWWQDISSQKGFEMLNPYVEKTNAKGQKVYDKKNGLEMLFDVTDAMKVADPKAKQAIMDKVAKMWHVGDFSALQSVMQDMDSANNSTEVQKHGGVKGFMRDLGADFGDGKGGATPEDLQRQVDRMSATMMDSWTFRMQRMQTMWDISTAGVFEKLKGEFGTVSDQISVFLRLIRDHASTFAAGVSLLGKIGLALGVRFAAGKVGNWIEKTYEGDRQKGLAGRFNPMAYNLNEEGRAVNLRRTMLSDMRSERENRLGIVNSKRTGLGIDQKKAEMERLNQEIAAHVAKRDDLEKRGMAGTPEHQAEGQAVLDKDAQRLRTGRMLSRAQSQDPKLDAEAKQLDAELRQLNRAYKDVERQASSVNTRIELLNLAMKDENFEAKRLETAMNKVKTGFQTGALTANSFRQAVTQMGQSAGMSDTAMTKLLTDVDMLNKSFERGTISLEEYYLKMKQLERTNLLQNSGVSARRVTESPGGPLGPISKTEPLMGMNLADAVMGYGLLRATGGLGKAGTAAAGAKPGIMARAFGAIKGGLGLGTIASKAGALMKDTKIGKGLGVGLKALKLGGKQIPYLSMALAAMDVFSDGIMPLFQTKGENMNRRATNLDSLSQSSANLADMSAPVKYGGGVVNFLSNIPQMALNLAGSKTATSIKENWDAMLATMGGKNSTDVKAKLDKEFGTDKKKTDATLKMKEEALARENKKDPMLRNTQFTSFDEVQTFDDAQLLLSRLQQSLAMSLSTNEASMTHEKMLMAVSGVREDSAKMRDLMDEFFQKNIDALDIAIKGATERRDSITNKGSDAYVAMDTELQKLQMQQDQLKAQKYQDYQNADITRITNNLNYDLKASKDDFQIKKDQMILSGAKEDAWPVKDIDRQATQAQNTVIGTAIGQLEALKNKYPNDETMLRKLNEQIKNLNTQTQDNLVNIYKALQAQKSTFNLPDGVKAMTYWENKTKDTNFKNYSVNSGDIIVNITADKITGNEQDLQKIGEAVSQAAKKAHSEISRELAQQVKSGMQNNYRPN